MNILITGVTGFLGKQLLNFLLNNSNYSIGIILRDYNKLNYLNINDKFSHRLTVIMVNNIKWKQQVKLFNPNIVIHLAAYLSSSDDETVISNLISSNIEFGCNVLDALKDTKVQYFINTGTFAEYGSDAYKLEPAYLYAATKSAFRSFLNYYQSVVGFKIINVIPYTIYGGVDSQKKLIDFIYQSTLDSVPINMSPGEQVLDFIHINDVINFYKVLIENINNIHQTYTELALGTSVGTTPKQLAEIIEAVTQKKTNINWGGVPYRVKDTMYSVANLSTTINVLNWKPNITIQKGIELYINQKNKEK